MRTSDLERLSDVEFQRKMPAVLVNERVSTAAVVAHIAAYDERKLYLPAGFPSMYSYCVEGHNLSEGSAYKRIQAARVSRRFPILLESLQDGRLHLSGVCLLAPHVTTGNVDELVREATYRRKKEIDEFLKRRFPSTEDTAPKPAISPLPSAPMAPAIDSRPPANAVRNELIPAFPSTTTATSGQAAPAAPARYTLHVTIDQRVYDKLQRLVELLSHAVPSGDVAQVIERAFDTLLHQLEKKKFASTNKPGPSRPSARRRHIPAPVKRAVWKRDHGQCTFVSEAGRRCASRKFLEYDHVDPVARGGEAAVDRIRLRCRGHNQYEAEKAFGAQFMKDKREEARRKRQAGTAASGLRRFG